MTADVRPGPKVKQVVKRGQRFGRWVVVDPEVRKGKHRAAVVRCNCPAKTVRTVVISSLHNGDSTSCGCMPRTPKLVVRRGQRFGRLVVIKPEVQHVQPSGKTYRAASCRCDCGKRVTVPVSEFFREGRQRRESCGCWRRERASERGRSPEQIARLTEAAQSPENRRRMAELGRVMGKRPRTAAQLAVFQKYNRSPEGEAARSRLIAYSRSPEGRARSSEVARRPENLTRLRDLAEQVRPQAIEATRTHGMSKHPLFVLWRNMIRRCEDPASDNFQYYGALDVQVCPEWHDPAVFIAWIEANIGPRPAGVTAGGYPVYTLDRIDCRGNYEPGNVRWADWRQQRVNQRPSARRRR